MTDGGKPHRITDTADLAVARSAFAPLRPFLNPDESDLTQAVRKLSAALVGFEMPLRLQVQVLEGSKTHDWELECGREQITVGRREIREAAVRVVVRHGIWLQIARGELNPFDAFISGKLRVGGDTDLAKQLVEHLSDPSVPYVSPC